MLETCGSAGKRKRKGVNLPGDRVVEVLKQRPALARDDGEAAEPEAA